MRQKDGRAPVWQGPGDENHPSVSLSRGFLKDVWQKQKGGTGTGNEQARSGGMATVDQEPPLSSSHILQCSFQARVRDNPEVGLKLQTLPPAKTISEFLFGDP